MKDPICGMDVDQSNPKFQSEYKNKTYIFCSNYCKKKFDENPSQYVKENE